VRRHVQWCLPVSAACMDTRAILCEERPYRVHSPQPRGCVDVDFCSALDQKIREAMIVVEDAESAGPPMAALIDVRPICQQQFDHRDVWPPDGGEKPGLSEGR